MFRLLVPVFLLLSSICVSAQKTTLRGSVTDAETTQGMPGAVVQVEGTTINTVTDALGRFVLSNIPIGTQTLSISFVSYFSVKQTLDIKPGENTLKPVTLKPGNVSLNELVVTADKPQDQQLISSLDIKLRPIMNSQEVLRMVPGLFIGQHAGGGKAEQIFLRGFDIDHGTDIALAVDGMPVNMVSHAHGQGYADLHFVIPELIEKINFRKGTYSAEHGNFSTAGWVDFRTRDVLDRSFVKTEIGQFNTYRLLGAVNLLSQQPDNRPQSAYIASEYNYSDSYFDSPQHFKRFNLIGKWDARLTERTKMNLSVSTFWSKWNHSGQIPDRAVESGQVSFFGAIDDTEGGETSRSNINLQLYTQTNRGLLRNQVYYTNYNFELYSNFTFFKEDPINGDQIRQREARNLFGYNGSYTTEGFMGNKPLSSSAGISYRHDFTQNSELSRTLNRTETLNRLMLGDINEANLGAYWNEQLRLNSFWTVIAGLRYDFFTNQYLNKPDNTIGRATQGIVSPKFNVFYTPSQQVQVYLNTGKSFHSNDTRVVVPQRKRNILPPAYGSDLGVNWKPFPRLFINAAAFYLWLGQEFVYVGDEGVVEPSGKTRRMGLDFTARYQLSDKLFADLDLNLTKPRFVNEAEGQNLVPLAPRFTSVGGLTYSSRQGLNGSLRYRFMGNRPANEDNSIVAQGYMVYDAQLNYTKPRYMIGLSVNNLLNTKWKETQFATESRLKNEPAPVDEIHFTAGSPFFARLSLTYFLK